MSKRCVLKRMVFILVLLASMGGLISCIPTPGEEVAAVDPEPRAWIDFPRDGVSVPVGASVIVVSHAYADDGVAEVMLSVNGTAYRRDPPTTSGDTFVEVRQEWVPTLPGLHTLEVRTYGADGVISNSDAITVRVIGDALVMPTEVVPTEVPSATEVPAATKVPEATEVPEATATPVPTGVPTDVPTDVPTAVPTDVPTDVPTQVPTEVPTAVPTDIPTEVPTTVPTVTPTPVDDTAPPVPSPDEPAGGEVVGCPASGKQKLEWTPVDDPSGVVYYVKLEQQVTAKEWNSVAGWGPVSGTQVEADVTCGGIYRWTVRAQDGVGNISVWAPYANFGVNLD
jgi:hypothetical protein